MNRRELLTGAASVVAAAALPEVKLIEKPMFIGWDLGRGDVTAVFFFDPYATPRIFLMSKWHHLSDAREAH